MEGFLVWKAYIWRGSYMVELVFGILRYLFKSVTYRYTHFHLTDSEAAIVRSLMKQAEVSILSCLVDCFEIIQVNAGW